MTVPNESPNRDETNWAKPVDRLTASAAATRARHDGVTGKKTAGPLQGFGQMWQKVMQVPLAGADVTPREVVATWKEGFPTFWPRSASFHVPLAGIQPGEVALLELKPGPGPVRLSTGVVCIYADDDSFAFMTPEGHALAAWITFSAHEKDGVTYARIEALERPADPLIELAYLFGGNRTNDRFWEETLVNLAAHLGSPGAVVDRRVVCVDKGRQWRYFGNIRRSVALAALVNMVSRPFGARRG